MIMTIYKRVLAVLMRKPLKLWGISLLAVVLSTVLVSLCGFAIPGLGLAVGLVLSTSMMMVYLHGYRGEEVEVLQLFDGFKDWNTIKRVVLGLAWMDLWIFLWALIPIVGPIFAVIRSYEYRLTPYILVTEPDVPQTKAIELSKERTNGYKLQMFGAEALAILAVYVGFFLVGLVAGVLGMIPVLGPLLVFVIFLALIVVIAVMPLFFGLLKAAFYEEITNPTMALPSHEAPASNSVEDVMKFNRRPSVDFDSEPAFTADEPVRPAARRFCKECGTPLKEGMLFCINCGTKQE